MEVGLTLKNYIGQHGMTQAFLSRETGIDKVKLNLALNGNRRLTFDEYSLICGVLGVSTAAFLEPRLPEEKGDAAL